MKNTPQPQKMSWRDDVLLPWLVGHSKESSERATRQYLEDIDSTSCLNLLNKALDQLLHGDQEVKKIFSNYATTNPCGKHVWNRDSFARYINARLPENPAVTASCVVLLWCTFSTGAYFPFLEKEAEIDIKWFKRAFAFLVLRGYELLGALSNGQSLPWSIYWYPRELYPEKVPRLARIVFRSLSTTPGPQSGRTQSQDPHESSLQLHDIKDTIAFTQPILRRVTLKGDCAAVAEGEFEAAACRLLLADHKQSTVTRGPSSTAVSKADSQILIRLFLLQRAEDRPWRSGLKFSTDWPDLRSGDIMFSHSVSGPDEEVSRASKLASAFVAHHFPGSYDYVTWDQFKACLECPSFLFSFFRLWATIFAPTTAPRAPPYVEDESNLSISTINILSLLNVAYFFPAGPPDQAPVNRNESQFQLDLQASTLVAHLATTPKLSVEELHKIIAARTWFHVMIIQGEDLKVEEGKSSSSRLIIAFTSPPENEMWQRELEHEVGYVWRTSVVQLEPDIAVTDSGGMSASVVGEVLELGSHKWEGISMKVDLARRVVDVTGLCTRPTEDKSIEGLSKATSTLVMRLTDLKCYRMPGVSSQITRSGGRVAPTWVKS